MTHPRLRVYFGPQDTCQDNGGSEVATLPMRETVTLPLGEVLPILVDAIGQRRSWVEDFHDDDVTISRDLHEILLAYSQFRRPSA